MGLFDKLTGGKKTCNVCGKGVGVKCIKKGDKMYCCAKCVSKDVKTGKKSSKNVCEFC